MCVLEIFIKGRVKFGDREHIIKNPVKNNSTVKEKDMCASQVSTFGIFPLSLWSTKGRFFTTTIRHFPM